MYAPASTRMATKAPSSCRGKVAVVRAAAEKPEITNPASKRALLLGKPDMLGQYCLPHACASVSLFAPFVRLQVPAVCSSALVLLQPGASRRLLV